MSTKSKKQKSVQKLQKQKTFYFQTYKGVAADSGFTTKGKISMRDKEMMIKRETHKKTDRQTVRNTTKNTQDNRS